jgi:hypothetical protein
MRSLLQRVSGTKEYAEQFARRFLPEADGLKSAPVALVRQAGKTKRGPRSLECGARQAQRLAVEDVRPYQRRPPASGGAEDRVRSMHAAGRR